MTSPRYLGPGSTTTAPLAYINYGRGSRWPDVLWCMPCPLLSLASGGGADIVGGAARSAPRGAAGHVSPFGRLLVVHPLPRPRPLSPPLPLSGGRHDPTPDEDLAHAPPTRRAAAGPNPPCPRQPHACPPH